MFPTTMLDGLIAFVYLPIFTVLSAHASKEVEYLCVVCILLQLPIKAHAAAASTSEYPNLL